MLTKALAIKEMDEKGVGLALLAKLDDVDKDGDTYTKGAFAWKTGGQWSPIVPAHNWKEMPFGKARTYEQGEEALAEIRLNLDTQAGKDWHAALKFDLETGQPVQQWSYGYDVLDYTLENRAGQKVRNLVKLDVLEVSPVIVGAGKGTRTLAMKGAGMKGVAMKEEAFAATLEQLQEMAAAIDANPGLLSATGLKQARDIRASLDQMIAAKQAADADAASGKAGDPIADRAIAAFLYNSVKHHIAK